MISELKAFLNERALRNLGRELRPDELQRLESDGDMIWAEATRQAQAHYEEYEELEASVCPEDVGFVEYIGALQKRLVEAQEHEKAAVEQVHREWEAALATACGAIAIVPNRPIVDMVVKYVKATVDDAVEQAVVAMADKIKEQAEETFRRGYDAGIAAERARILAEMGSLIESCRVGRLNTGSLEIFRNSIIKASNQPPRPAPSYQAANDIVSWRTSNPTCPTCGVVLTDLHPEANLYPHWTGVCKVEGSEK